MLCVSWFLGVARWCRSKSYSTMNILFINSGGRLMSHKNYIMTYTYIVGGLFLALYYRFALHLVEVFSTRHHLVLYRYRLVMHEQACSARYPRLVNCVKVFIPVTRRFKGYTILVEKYVTGKIKLFRPNKVYIFLIRINSRIDLDMSVRPPRSQELISFY